MTNLLVDVDTAVEFLSAIKVGLKEPHISMYAHLFSDFEEIDYIIKVGKKYEITSKGTTALGVLTEFYDKFGE
jgi:hypothetical protein